MTWSWLIPWLGALTPLFPQDEDPGVLIRAERVIVRPGEVLEDVSILIQRGKILAVGAGLAAPAGARVIEGDVVCAGFFDAWSQLGLDPGSVRDLGTGPTVRTLDAIDAWSDEALRNEALRGGVTVSRLQAGMKASIGGIGTVVRTDPELVVQRLEDAVLLDDACVAATVGVSRFGRAGDVFDRVSEVDKLAGQLDKALSYYESLLEYDDELAEWTTKIAEEAKELEKDFKKAKKARDKDLEEAEEKGKEFKEKRYKEDKKPRKPKYDADSAVLARVVNGELPLVVEAHGFQELKRLLAATAKFDRLRLVIAGGSQAQHFAQELADRHVPVICWPVPLGDGRASEYEEHDLGLAAELARAGVDVVIGSGGTDAARDLRLLAALAVGHGLDPDAALRAITQTPAEVFDLKARLGTVERGKDADLLVFDGDPLAATSRIRFVLSGGRVVIDNP